jgi:hypothetical protein
MTEVTRRDTIKIATASLGCLSAIIPAIISASTTSTSHGSSQLRWPKFISLLSLLASEHRSRTINDTEYVGHAYRLLKAVSSHTLPPIKSPVSSTPPHPEFHQLTKATDYEVTLIVMSAGHALPAHDHPDITGVSSGISGRLLINKYDLLPQPRDSDHAFLSRVDTRTIKAGDTACVMTDRSNIYSLA